jgi:hypothetical protein
MSRGMRLETVVVRADSLIDMAIRRQGLVKKVAGKSLVSMSEAV